MEDKETQSKEVGSSFVSRVNQLDAEALDDELVKLVKATLQRTFKHFIRNPLDVIGPELEALIKLMIWNYTLKARSSSVGQQMLGIQLQATNRIQIYATGVVYVLVTYIKSRLHTLFSWLPETPQVSKLKSLSEHLEALLKLGELVNFVVFLQQGTYPTLLSRCLQLKPRSLVQGSRAVHYTFMSRELIWHTLTEVIIFILPFINCSKFFNKFRTASTPTDDGGLNCCICRNPAVSRVMTGCQHVYCHYCIMAELGERDWLTCSMCNEKCSKHSFIYGSNHI